VTLTLAHQASLPGFTANSSLADRVGLYRSEHPPHLIQVDVQAQLLGYGNAWGHGECRPDCLCFWGINCPCCFSIPVPRPYPGTEF
jgi:hypothetical protein